jgi:putative transcriptional regulator
MVEVLRNKNLATRFQILVEIAKNGPSIQQQAIARELEVTPQAISYYMAKMLKNNLIIADGRSRYRITSEGINWIIKELRELKIYCSSIEKAVTNISICAAVAADDLTKGQKVTLEMHEGLLYATVNPGKSARGVVVNNAKKGEDVGITGINGIVSLEVGKVTVLRIPGIDKGGSRNVNLDKLRENTASRDLIGALGIEAIVILNKASINYSSYGTIEAAIESANTGLKPLVVATEDETTRLITRLQEAGIDYELIDLTLE